MLARRLRIFLALLVSGIGSLAWQQGQHGPLVLGAWAIGGVLALIALMVAVSYAVAAVSPTKGAPGEYAATAWAYLVSQPFPDAWIPLDPREGTGAPVLLVHGYFCNRGAHWLLARRLRAAGYRVFAIDLEPACAGIDDYVGPLAARIDHILAETGRSKLALVCHSMGGLAFRAYLAKHGAGKVAVAVTIGTPHHGTRHAALGVGKNARQMRPGSAWLRGLEARERGIDRPPMVSIYSRDDNIVAPPDTSVLEGAENAAFAGTGHLALLCARPVAQRVIEHLRAHLTF